MTARSDFELTEGIPFIKNGTPTGSTVDIEDVFLSFDLQIGEAGNHPSKLSRNPGRWLEKVSTPDNWDVLGDRTFRINSQQVNITLGYWLSEEWSVGIVSKDHWDAVGGEDGYMDDPVGTGPWSYLNHEVDRQFLYEKVENHWRKTPEFDELQILLVKESATRMAMLFAREADLIPVVRTQKQSILDGGFKVFRSTLPSVHQAIGFIYYRSEFYCPDGVPPPGTARCGASEGYDLDDPLRNAQVRLALNYAVNRDEFNNTFYNGEGQPLLDYYFPWSPAYREEWHKFPNDQGRTGIQGGWP